MEGKKYALEFGQVGERLVMKVMGVPATDRGTVELHSLLSRMNVLNRDREGQDNKRCVLLDETSPISAPVEEPYNPTPPVTKPS